MSKSSIRGFLTEYIITEFCFFDDYWWRSLRLKWILADLGDLFLSLKVVKVWLKDYKGLA